MTLHSCLSPSSLEDSLLHQTRSGNWGSCENRFVPHPHRIGPSGHRYRPHFTEVDMDEIHKMVQMNSLRRRGGPDGCDADYDQPSNLSWTNTRQGSSCLNYQWKIANNIDATTSFIGQRHEFILLPGRATLTGWNPFVQREAYDLYTGSVFTDVDYSVQWSLPMYAEADNLARTKFFKDVRSAQMKLSGLTVLGELREAIHMVRHPADALRRGLSDYLSVLSKRKARNPGRRQRHKILQDTWLEFSFGWKPLIQDCKGAMLAYKAVIDNEEWIPISSTGIVTKDLGTTGPQNLDQGRVSFWYEARSSQKCMVRYKTKVRGSNLGPSDLIDRSMDMFGFRLDEFVPTAWELLPWSFFIDYFSNIGDVITAASTSKAEYNWVCQTVRYEGKIKLVSLGINSPRTQTLYPFGGGNFRSCDGSLGSLTHTNTRVTRNAVAEIGIPNLAFQLPGSLNQVFNLTALFARSKGMSPFF